MGWYRFTWIVGKPMKIEGPYYSKQVASLDFNGGWVRWLWKKPKKEIK